MTKQLEATEILFFIFNFLLCSSYARYVNDAFLKQYEAERKKLVFEDQRQLVGSNLTLNAKEIAVSNFLLEEKNNVFESSRVNSTVFPTAESFFKTKDVIDASPIFEVIKRMPKGGILHIHDSALMDPIWLVQNASYRSNLYMCHSSSPSFYFYRNPPTNNGGCDVGWELISAIRARETNVTAFDQRLYQNLTLYVPNPDEVYFNQNQVWSKFQSIFNLLNGIFNYVDVFRDYIGEALQWMMDDNVMYVEIRALLQKVYDLDGNMLSSDEIMRIYEDEYNKFVAQHPGFAKPKIIHAQLRFETVDTIQKAIENSLRLRKQFPSTFVGFDLVAQEDTLNTLQYYIEPLLYPSSIGERLNYYFHAGETDFQGTQVDGNLYDALLLNTSRIGHGYAMSKHPKLMEMAREMDVPLEVNPISNQLLMLVTDLRDHPAAMYFSSDMPVIVSSDDPALFGTSALSHDFYAAFMAFSGEKGDLRVLKQLAINSIKYSAMSEEEKSSAMGIWRRSWDSFIDDTMKKYTLVPDTTVTTPEPDVTDGSSSASLIQHSALVAFICLLFLARFT